MVENTKWATFIVKRTLQKTLGKKWFGVYIFILRKAHCPSYAVLEHYMPFLLIHASDDTSILRVMR